MPGENEDPQFEAFVERVMELKRTLPELAALLAEIEGEGYDVRTHPGLSKLSPVVLEAMRQFSRGELTEGQMFFQVVGEVFPWVLKAPMSRHNFVHGACGGLKVERPDHQSRTIRFGKLGLEGGGGNPCFSTLDPQPSTF